MLLHSEQCLNVVYLVPKIQLSILNSPGSVTRPWILTRQKSTDSAAPSLCSQTLSHEAGAIFSADLVNGFHWDGASGPPTLRQPHHPHCPAGVPQTLPLLTWGQATSHFPPFTLLQTPPPPETTRFCPSTPPSGQGLLGYRGAVLVHWSCQQQMNECPLAKRKGGPANMPYYLGRRVQRERQKVENNSLPGPDPPPLLRLPFLTPELPSDPGHELPCTPVTPATQPLTSRLSQKGNLCPRPWSAQGGHAEGDGLPLWNKEAGLDAL